MKPIHPMFVHFPVALVLTATLISLLAVLFKNRREELKIVLFWILILAAISALAAMLTGLYQDASGVYPEDNAIHQIMKVHKLLGIIIASSMIVITLWFVIRKHKIQFKELLIITLFLFLTSGVLAYSGYLGGKMVYEEGEGVKPMEQYIMRQPGGSLYKPGEINQDSLKQGNNMLPERKKNTKSKNDSIYSPVK